MIIIKTFTGAHETSLEHAAKEADGKANEWLAGKCAYAREAGGSFNVVSTSVGHAACDELTLFTISMIAEQSWDSDEEQGTEAEKTA
jgi:hypothetical protein